MPYQILGDGMWNTKRNVVVLNKYGEYWNETTTRKAVSKIMGERAKSIAADETIFLGTIIKEQGWNNVKYFPLYKPLVIQLLHFDYWFFKTDIVPYADRQVFIRDKNICQYWHDYKLELGSDGRFEKIDADRHQYKVSLGERTLDHVIPVSRNGKKSNYENVVCCCRYCNEVIKKNMTPREAGLQLITQPKTPTRVKGDMARNLFLFNENKQSHIAYLQYKKQFNE